MYSPRRDAPVLLLFDEVLNFVNRHRPMAEPFHAFLQNLTVAVTGTTQAAAVISLPRSQVEMTDWDQQWQDRITKVVRRVARDLIANDEVAHLPKLRFALGEPDVDTTTIDNAATALEGSGFFIPQGRHGRLSHPPSSDATQGRQRPPGFARRGRQRSSQRSASWSRSSSNAARPCR